MNIFVLDRDPYKAAEMMCDKHVVKMIVESCQMLSAGMDITYKESGKGKSKDEPSVGFKLPQYPKSVKKHPCTLWLVQSIDNYKWLMAHTDALLKEYQKRYNKTHKYGQGILPPLAVYQSQLGWMDLPDIPQTEFIQAISNEQLRRDDPVEGYREYYLVEKAHFAKWKLGNVPEWFSNAA